MPYICYEDKNFQDATLRTIQQAREIIEEYTEAGYQLTLRQLYYQMVARDLIANEQKEYNRLGRIVNDARLAGYIDWNTIEDRTRSLRSLSHWENAQSILRQSGNQFRTDKWATQPARVEVWIEKDALVGVIEPVCERLDVPYFSCRGYTSQSEMWGAGQRLLGYIETGQRAVILHLGDHDPSGTDMTRDVRERLEMFAGGTWQSEIRDRSSYITVERIGLTPAQIEEVNPPPNPAKRSDSRYRDYVKRTGFTSSWELDALDPAYLDDLIEENVLAHRDVDAWEKAAAAEEEERMFLKGLYKHHNEARSMIEEKTNGEA